ncbi:MFS transporter [Dolosigranulum pigrum]|uniref:MFS transporter n=1 Tax=Dolosigranulum pigrum TaxID=29394 RepID=UPI001FCB68C4|nr:MFS transporter [Dolosigranulum pigrum]
MISLKQYPSNFRQLILGRSTLNIGDSLYLIAFSFALVEVYHVSETQLALITLIGRLPLLLSFLYGGYINQLNNKKAWLIRTQWLHVFSIIFVIVAYLSEASLIIICLLNASFYLINNVQNTLNSTIVPLSLNNDLSLINKSIDIQYLTSNVLDIASNFLASLLLIVLAYHTVMGISLPIILLGIYFYTKLTINNQAISQESRQGFSSQLKTGIHYFFSKKDTSLIIVIESFLSGATDLLLTLAPIYLLDINLSLESIGVVFALQRGADFLGALYAPRINMRPKHFFYVDYLVSGLMLVLVFVIDNVWIKMICYFIAFFVIGISGNIFEKMIYESYEPDKLAGIYTIISSLFSFFGVAFLLVPSVYSNIHVLGIGLNSLTIIFGLVIFIKLKMKNKFI